MSVREAMRHRRSYSRVTEAAPTHDELVDLVSAAGREASTSENADGNVAWFSVDELPELDAIFLSYACALLDATPRTLRT